MSMLVLLQSTLATAIPVMGCTVAVRHGQGVIVAGAYQADRTGATCRFSDNQMKSVHEGGTFAVESIETYEQQLAGLDSHVAKVQEAGSHAIEQMREAQSKANDEALKAVVAALPAHREDLAVLEAINKCMFDARRCAKLCEFSATMRPPVAVLLQRCIEHERHSCSGTRLAPRWYATLSLLEEGECCSSDLCVRVGLADLCTSDLAAVQVCNSVLRAQRSCPRSHR